MSKDRQNLQGCQIVEELSANDGFVSYRVTCPDVGPCRLLLAHPHARLAVKGHSEFFDRADALSRLKIPGVATVLDAGFYQERVACLLPLCEGAPLYEYRSSLTTVGEVLTLCRAIVEDLAVAHAQGVCHANITPNLILVDPNKRPLLCDFALSQLFMLDYNSGVDPKYCSPEQVRGELSTPASDIYSLGCILYLLLTGTSPYNGKNNFSIATRHLEGEFPALPGELSKCNSLISTMTRLIPSQRSNAEEVINQLGYLLADKALCDLSCGVSEEAVEAEFISASADDTVVADAPLSSISSKVEALLREQNFDAAEPDLVGAEMEPPEPVEMIESSPAEVRDSGTGDLRRYVVLLLVGIAVGMSLFLAYSYWQDSYSASEIVGADDSYPVDILDNALKQWDDDDIAAAEQALNTLIGDYPEDPRAYNNLAALYSAQGELDQARNLLERGLATNQDYLALHKNLGSVYAEMARESYGKALQLDSPSSTVLPLRVFSSQGLFLLKRDPEAPAGDVAVVSQDEADVADDVVALSGQAQTGDSSVAVGDLPAAVPAVVADTSSVPSVAPEAAVPVKEAAAEGSTVDNPEGSSRGGGETPLPLIQEFLKNWAAAWSGHDVERYLSYYADEFVPAGGVDKEAWEAQRRRRLQVPGEIQILLSDYKIAAEDEHSFTVEVMQSYQSPRYSDVTRKQFELVQPAGEFKILRENALEIMR